MLFRHCFSQDAVLVWVIEGTAPRLWSQMQLWKLLVGETWLAVSVSVVQLWQVEGNKIKLQGCHWCQADLLPLWLQEARGAFRWSITFCMFQTGAFILEYAMNLRIAFFHIMIVILAQPFAVDLALFSSAVELPSWGERMCFVCVQIMNSTLPVWACSQQQAQSP